MSANSVPSARSSGLIQSRLGTILVMSAILIVLAVLGYMEQFPAVLRWPMRILFAASIVWLGYAAFRKILATKFEVKKVVFCVLLVGLLYGLLVGKSHVLVKIMGARDHRLTTASVTSLSKNARRGIETMIAGENYSVYDRDIGWVPRPGFQWKMHSISEQGLRSTRTYPETPPDPEKRVLCLGDSFTFGYEVGDDEVFTYQAEQMLPETEWINMGNCGTGLTQSLMQYRKNGRKFGGKYVVIGFMTLNVKRTVNCFRPFISPQDITTPLAKPFAKIVDGEFSLEPNPYQEVSDYEGLLADESGELESLYRLDYPVWSNQRPSTNPLVRALKYIGERRNVDRNLAVLFGRATGGSYGRYRPGDNPYGSSIWHPKSPGFQANTKVFDILYEEIIADGREPLIVILPSIRDVEKRADGQGPSYASLLAHFDEKGYRYFDFLDSLETIHGDNLGDVETHGRSHFNAETHKLLAQEIVKALPFSDSSNASRFCHLQPRADRSR